MYRRRIVTRDFPGVFHTAHSKELFCLRCVSIEDFTVQRSAVTLLRAFLVL